MTESARQQGEAGCSAQAVMLPKISTRIRGLDEILHGGFPSERMTLIRGAPGCGKSVLSMEFLYRGALDGEPGIFVAFEERAAAVRQNARSLGWDLAALEGDNRLWVMEAHLDPHVILSSTFNLQGLFGIIGGKAAAMGARRIVLDAVDVLLQILDDPARERQELYALHEWLLNQKMTALMTIKTSAHTEHASRYEFLDFMADCVMHLNQRVSEQVSTRRLRVIKYRGSGFGHNQYPYIITQKGFTLSPIPAVSLTYQPLGAIVSSGNAQLDTTLGGGYRRGSALLVSGTTGTGKTTLAATFVQAACQRGDRVLYISFEESAESLVACLLSPGIDLRPALQAGTLRLQTHRPEALSVEEHLIAILSDIAEFQPHHVVVDAISSCNRMGTERAAFEYAVTLLHACKERRSTCMLLNQTEGFHVEYAISGVGVSSLIDTVLFLRYIDAGGEVNRMLLVLKARGTKHSNQYREFFITDRGIDLAEVYVGEGGVLTGIARQEQEAKEAATYKYTLEQIRRKEYEVAQKRAMQEAQAVTLRTDLEAAEAELDMLRLEAQQWQSARQQRAHMRHQDAQSDQPHPLPQPQRQQRASSRGEGA